ncbi:hypothetical protein HPB47_016584 [Ixodes persulcatus]|uniref:Uncharacterized protein n=1 Tax=Ixodes persulcatus TaxID=34615 RepID=A0AC60QSZ0_IXOPE|nr:hypothetical protein HPB47_016584 [Ixodes persulcatus]
MDRPFTYDPALRVQVVVDGNIFLHHCRYALTDRHLTQFRTKIREVRAIADEETRKKAWKDLNAEIAERYVQIYKGDMVTDFVEDYHGGDDYGRDLDPGCENRDEGECEQHDASRANERCIRYDAFFATVFNCISRTVKKVIGGLALKARMDVDVVVVFDGISPTVKWAEQYCRRRNDILTVMKNDNDAATVGNPAKRARLTKNSKLQSVLEEPLKSLARCGRATMSTVCRLTAASDVMQHVASFFDLLEDEDYAKIVIDGYDNSHDRVYQMTSLTLLPPVYAGEGDVKVIDTMLCAPKSNSLGDVSVIVTDDSDVLLGVASVIDKIPSREVYVYSARQYTESRKRRDEYAFELPGGQGDCRVSLLDNFKYPSRQRGYYHIKDDFFGRLLRMDTFDFNPLTFAVPILMYGGYEIMSLLISASKKPDHMNVAMFRAMINATREETSFYFILLAAVKSIVQYETATTATRTRVQARTWSDVSERGKEVEKLAIKYTKLLQYTAMYAMHQGQLAWYLSPELRESMSACQNRAAQVTLVDVATVLEKLYNRGEFETTIDARPFLLGEEDTRRDSILADYERDSDASVPTKALYALHIMGALEANGSWWTDVDAVVATYRWYEINCLCPCIEPVNLRRILSIFQQPADELSRTFTSRLIRSSYKRNRRRLGNLKFPDFLKVYKEMSS